MTSLLICARGYDQLSRAKDFFELDPDPAYMRHYVHDNIHEEYRDPSLYIRHIETTYKSGAYDHIVFWGVPSRTPQLKKESYSCIFEDVDHILYPAASSTHAMIAWWKKKVTQRFFENARYIIALSEHSSQFLRESIAGKEDQHFCLKALPLSQSIQSSRQYEVNQAIFDHENRIATVIGNEHTHDNLELFLKIANTSKYLVIAGSDLRNAGYAEAQKEYLSYFEGTIQEGENNLSNPQDITIIPIETLMHGESEILALIDLHMTSGISETLRWALSQSIPVITLNHHSLSMQLRSEGYPLILSLARLAEIPELLSSLMREGGERSEIWDKSRQVLKKIYTQGRDDQKRSSRHMYFLIEKAIKTQNVQK